MGLPRRSRLPRSPPVLQPRAVHGHQGPGLCQVLVLWLRLATELMISLPGG